MVIYDNTGAAGANIRLEPQVNRGGKMRGKEVNGFCGFRQHTEVDGRGEGIDLSHLAQVNGESNGNIAPAMGGKIPRHTEG